MAHDAWLMPHGQERAPLPRDLRIANELIQFLNVLVAGVALTANKIQMFKLLHLQRKIEFECLNSFN